MKYQFILVLMLFLTCENPFFPETTIPKEEVVRIMDTPGKTIRRLQQNYEYQNIEHFENTLLYDSTFKYYIQEPFSSIDDGFENITSFDFIDDPNIPSGNYLVVDYTEEVELHREMFEAVTDIDFIKPLRYSDSTYLNDDSTEIMVWTDETSISIKLSANYQNLYTLEDEYTIHDQIFHLKLDTSDGQWKIYRWYELN